jgi:hypothetical protein
VLHFGNSVARAPAGVSGIRARRVGTNITPEILNTGANGISVRFTDGVKITAPVRFDLPFHVVAEAIDKILAC